MARVRLVTFRCDRCPTEVTVDEALPREGWGALSARGKGFVRQLGVEGSEPLDLCPDCYQSLLAWFANAKADPAPAPPPTPMVLRPRRRLTIEDRKAITALIQSGLAAQTEATFSAIQEQPTSIVTGELAPEAIATVGPRAEGLTEALIARIDPKPRAR